MRAMISTNPDGAYKILLVPETDMDRYNLQNLDKFSRSIKINATVNIIRPLHGQVGITLVAEDMPKHEVERSPRDRRQSER